MSLTTAQANKVNRSNRACKDASLGTAVLNLETASAAGVAKVGASGSYAAVAADASNAKVAITTGLTAVNGFIAQVRRSGSAMPFMKMTAGSVAGTIEIFKDPTYTGGSSIAAADVVTWIAF